MCQVIPNLFALRNHLFHSLLKKCLFVECIVSSLLLTHFCLNFHTNLNVPGEKTIKPSSIKLNLFKIISMLKTKTGEKLP